MKKELALAGLLGFAAAGCAATQTRIINETPSELKVAIEKENIIFTYNGNFCYWEDIKDPFGRTVDSSGVETASYYYHTMVFNFGCDDKVDAFLYESYNIKEDGSRVDFEEYGIERDKLADYAKWNQELAKEISGIFLDLDCDFKYLKKEYGLDKLMGKWEKKQ
ncbi:MAG: hypothetical protein ABIB71_02760 [Candidatus Woesearchaeota archaeon]